MPGQHEAQDRQVALALRREAADVERLDAPPGREHGGHLGPMLGRRGVDFVERTRDEALELALLLHQARGGWRTRVRCQRRERDPPRRLADPRAAVLGVLPHHVDRGGPHQHLDPRTHDGLALGLEQSLHRPKLVRVEALEDAGRHLMGCVAVVAQSADRLTARDAQQLRMQRLLYGRPPIAPVRCDHSELARDPFPVDHVVNPGFASSISSQEVSMKPRPPFSTESTASAPTRAEGRLAEDRAAACEGAELALAARQLRTLDARETMLLEHHLATCDRCRAAAVPEDVDWRWLVRVPAKGFGAGPQLPVVDPQVFDVGRELASGGMGKVSLATDRRLGRVVALKEILDPDQHGRFEREVIITADLQHPAIIPIYEAGTWPDGAAFYTMRLVTGTTLQEAIDGATTLAARLALLHHVVDTVEAIAYAHGRRVIHRDLKTTNVLVGELGDTVVIDWGLAKYLDDDGAPESAPARPVIPRTAPDLTQVGTVMGTPGFMAPEQARGEATDERADVFALGAILYTLLAGVPPYLERGAHDADAALDRVALGPPRPIASLAPQAPADLRAICERAMAHRPADRYPTARELAIELRRFEAGQLLARPYGLGELVARWLRRHRAIVIAAALAVVAVAVIGTLAIRNVTRSRTAERTARHDAEAALAEARSASAAAFEEQARAALRRGEREPALVLLHQALERGRDTPALRYLLASALRDRGLARPMTLAPMLTVAFAASMLEPPLVVDQKGDVRRGPKLLFSQGRELHAAAIARDESWVIAYGANETLARWDLASGTERWRIDAIADEESESDFVVSPDDQLLAFASGSDGVVKLLDVETGARRGTVTVDGTVNAMAFEASSQQLAVASSTGQLVVFQAARGQAAGLTVRARWQAPAPVGRLRFRDPDHVVSAGGVLAVIWDLGASPPAPIHLRHRTKIIRLDVAPLTGFVATGAVDRAVRMWSADGVLLAIEHLVGRLGDLQFAPLGDKLAVTTGTELVVWDAPTFRLGLRAMGDYYDVRWDRAGTSLATDDPQTGRVLAFNAPGGNRWAVFESTAKAQLVGDRVIVAGKDGRIHARSQRGQVLGELPRFPTGTWIASQDGSRLLARSGKDDTDTVALVELPSGRTIATYNADLDLAIAPDGSRAVLLDELGDGPRMRVIDGTTGAVIVDRAFDPVGEPIEPAFLGTADEILVGRIKMGREIWATSTLAGRTLTTDDIGVASEVSVAPNGHFALYGRSGGMVTVHDPAGSGQLVGIALPRDFEKSVRLSADAKVLAVQNESGRIELFTVGFEPRPRAAVADVVLGAYAMSADGSLLFTGHPDGAARVWDTHTGRELDALRAHDGPIARLQLARDDATLLLGGTDGKSSLWEVARDAHTLDEVTQLVHASGWTFAGGIPRPPAS